MSRIRLRIPVEVVEYNEETKELSFETCYRVVGGDPVVIRLDDGAEFPTERCLEEQYRRFTTTVPGWSRYCMAF